MHDYEKMSEYHRGYEDGRRSLDVERFAVVLRLEDLRLADGSAENLANIAGAVWHGDGGWSRDNCAALRDEIIRLLGGARDGGLSEFTMPALDNGTDDHEQPQAAAVAQYDVLGNERHKVVCELRKMTIGSHYYENYQRIALAIGTAYDGKRFASSCVRDRLIYLLGGDECNYTTPESYTDASHATANPAETSDGEGDHVTLGTHLTDELRAYVGNFYLFRYKDVREKLAGIADRIDQRHADELAQPSDSDITAYYKQLKRWMGEAKHLRDKLAAHAKTLGQVEKERDYWQKAAADNLCDAEDNLLKVDQLLDMLRDAARDYKILARAMKNTESEVVFWRHRAEGMVARCDDLLAKYHRLKAATQVERAKIIDWAKDYIERFGSSVEAGDQDDA